MNAEKLYAESIVKEYAPKDQSKIAALRKLDRRAKMPANVFAYAFGIGSSLLAGLGMSLAMQVIGSGTGMLVLGIILGVIGFACMGVTYPIYKRLLEKGRKEYAYEIVRLAKEIAED